MAMALMNLHLTVVQSECSAILGLQVGLSTAETHGSAHVGATAFGHENDCGVWRYFIELSTVRPSLSKNVAREINHSNLQSETNTKVGFAGFSTIACRTHFSFDTTVPKSSGDKNAICLLDHVPISGMFLRILFSLVRLKILCLDPINVHLRTRVETRMLECLNDAEIRVGKSGVFSNHGNGQFPTQIVNSFGHGAPIIE